MPNKRDFAVETTGSKVTGTLTDKLPVDPNTPPTGLTAIGPRVTFHFITEPWSTNNEYQYYDVVNVNDNSYIAIKNVPSGTEITNTEYWFHWADPNAQYQELLNTVQTFDSRITTAQTTADDAAQSISNLEQSVNTKIDSLKETVSENTSDISQNSTDIASIKTRLDSIDQHAVIMIGDSYSVQNGDVSGWIKPTVAALNSNGVTCYTIGRGGYGFARPGMTFESLLDELLATMAQEQKDSVKTVLVAGGYNDNPYNATQISDAIESFQTKVQSTLKSANLKIAFIGNCTTDMPTFAAVRNACLSYQLACNNLGFDFKNGYNWILCNTAPFLSDNFHPTASSIAYLSANIINYLYDNDYQINSSFTVKNSSAEGCTITNTIFNFNYYDKELHTTAALNIKFDETTSSQTVTIGKLNLVPYGQTGPYYANCSFKLPDNTYRIGVSRFNIDYTNGEVRLSFFVLNDTNSGYLNAVNEVNLI